MMAVAGRPTTLEIRPQRRREAEAARCRSPAPPRDHALGGPVRSCPVGGSEMLASWGSGGHLGGGLVPPGDPQSQATLSSPAPRAQGGLLDGAPAAPKGPGDHFSARADDMIVHMKCFGTRQASAKPLPATLSPPPFRTRPHPADAHFPPSRRASSRRFFDALTVPSTLQFIPKLGGSRGRAEGRRGRSFLRANGMWPGASARKKIGRVRWPCVAAARDLCTPVCVLVLYEPFSKGQRVKGSV